MIVIQPWEKGLLKPIEKAILTSELGINPTNDGNCIRLVFPEMTEERRKEVSKDVKKKERERKLPSATSAATPTKPLRRWKRRGICLRTI